MTRWLIQNKKAHIEMGFLYGKQKFYYYLVSPTTMQLDR